MTGRREPDGTLRVSSWTAAERLDDIVGLIHAAFSGLEPPSSALRETVTDVTARQRRGLILVARVGDAFVGSVFAARAEDAFDLTRLAVHPAWRARGIGVALIEEAAEAARRDGAARLTLRVRQSLPGNLAYFRNRGFAETGVGQDPGRPPFIALERRVIAAK